MGAWTADQRLTLISMLSDGLYRPTLRDYQDYKDLVSALAGMGAEFLEANRDKFQTVITQYNDEKPDEEPAI